MALANLTKVLLIENSGADFFKSRLPLALYLKTANYEVSALVPDDGYVELIQEQGIKVLHYPIERGNKGVRQLLHLVGVYREIFKTNGFDIVHSFRFQPNLITALAALFLPSRVILHVTGLGIAYANRSLKYVFLRGVSQIVYFFKFLVSDLIIVQNPDDIKSLWFTRLNPGKVKVVLGSGINLALFSGDDKIRQAVRGTLGILPDDTLFICTTRLLWEKGILEMTEAFSDLQINNPAIKLYIVGWSDEDNPRHIPPEFIDRFKGNNSIVFAGKRNDIKDLLTGADVFIYPSYYREGIPRALLEALAMRLPIITTSTPGCRLTVKGNKNGVLVAPRSKEAIKQAVLDIVAQKPNHKGMGEESRILAEKKFSHDIIFREIERSYQQILYPEKMH